MAEKITLWYKQGLWTEAMVRDAVDKNIITKAQYAEITGKTYK